MTKDNTIKTFEVKHPDGKTVQMTAENAIQKHLFLDIFYPDPLPERMNESPDPDNPYHQIKVLVAPTGSGKSYSACVAIKMRIQELGGIDKYIDNTDEPPVVFVTPIKDNLPISRVRRPDCKDEYSATDRDMERVLMADGFMKREQFMRISIVYKSTEENLLDNYSLAREALKDNRSAWTPGGDFLDNLFTLVERVSVDPQSQETREKMAQADHKLRWCIRTHIKDELTKLVSDNSAKKTFDYKDYLNFIKDNEAEYGWIGILYPEIYLPEKKLIFCSVTKFFIKSTCIICGSSTVYDLPFMKGAHLVIDESDSAYDTMLGNIIDSIGPPYNLITILKLINGYVEKRKTFEQFLIGFYNVDTKSERGQRLKQVYEGTATEKGLQRSITDFYKERNMEGSFMGRKDQDDKDFRFFLFSSRINVTFIRNDKNRFACIRIANKDFDNNTFYYAADKPEDASSLPILIEDMSRLINRFFRFINETAEMAFPVRKLNPDTADETPSDTAIKLLGRIFSLEKDDELKRVREGRNIFEDLLYRNGPAGKAAGYVTRPTFDTSDIAGCGFQYSLVIKPGVTAEGNNISATTCFRTPETMLLAAARSMNITLVSATADVPSNICNFNFRYLSAVSGWDILPNRDEMAEIASDYNAMQQGNEDINVHVSRYGCTLEAYEENPLAAWAAALGEKLPTGLLSFRDDLRTFLTKDLALDFDFSKLKKTQKNDLIYKQCRLLKICDFFRIFWVKYMSGACPSAIYFSNVTLKETAANNYEVRPILDRANVKALINRIIARSGKKDKYDHDITADIVLIDINAKNILEQKLTAQQRLMDGLPVFLFTSYNTASVGQNLQMKMPIQYIDRMKETGVVPLKKDDGYVEANHAMIGLEKPTHLVYLIRESEHDRVQLTKDCIKGIFDVRSLADDGDLHPTAEKALIRHIHYKLCNYKYTTSDKSDATAEPSDMLSEMDSQNAMDRITAYRQQLYSCYGVSAKQDRCYMQAIGRMNRARMKFRNEYVFFDYDGFFRCDWVSDPALLTHEARACRDYFDSESVSPVHVTNKWTTSALQKEERSRLKTRALLKNLRRKAENNDEYVKLKRFLSGHISLSADEFRMLPSMYQDFYMQTDSHETEFWYSTDDREEDFVVKSISQSPQKGLSSISISDSRINDMLKIEGFADYLKSKGVQHEDVGNDYHITIYALISFYYGYIGELFVEYVFSRPGINIPLESLPYDRFELFDFRFTGVDGSYLDIKNWSSVRTESRLEKVLIPQYKSKAAECEARLLVYVNAISDVADLVVTEDTWTYEANGESRSARVLQVPAVADAKGHILYNNIDRIIQFLK